MPKKVDVNSFAEEHYKYDLGVDVTDEDIIFILLISINIFVLGMHFSGYVLGNRCSHGNARYSLLGNNS